MKLRSLGVLAALTLVVVSCGGNTQLAGTDASEIGIRGAWTIDIRNADSSLDNHIGFNNAFVGHEILADVLSMAESVAGWNVTAAPGGGPQICDTGSGGCSFSASADRDVTTDELVLTGSFVVEFDGTITQVFSNLVAESTGSNNTFSAKDLIIEGPGAVDVEAGQTVEIEVRYSFGTLP